jgi:hypothetical protein
MVSILFSNARRIRARGTAIFRVTAIFQEIGGT